MRRRTTGFLVLAVIAAVAAAPALTAAAETHIAIESVTTSVDDPAPNEPFTTTVTLENLVRSSGPVEVVDVYVREAGTTEEYARAENAGTISPGGQLSIPLTFSIDETGTKQLTVYAVVKDGDGDFTSVQYPLYVDVTEPDEAIISFADLDPVAGQPNAVTVTVSNGDTAALSNVQLELGGDAAIENPERVTASLGSGSQTAETFQVTFPESGEHFLNATLTYKTSEGVTRTVHRNISTTVEATNVDPELDARVVEANGSSAVRTSLTEFGNVELRDVQIRALVDEQVVARSLMADVPAEGTRTVTFDGSDIPAGAVTFEVEYTVAGERETLRTTLQYSPTESSNVALTGVEVTRQGSVLTLSGDVSNIGSVDAESVLVSIENTADVTPVSPNREYFVGGVDASEFATFQLTANATADVDRIPVRIAYSMNGERVIQLVDVDVSDAARNAGGESDSGGRLPAGVLLGVGIVALIVGGATIYRWRMQ